MILLSVDTTTPWSSVAVLRDGAVQAEHRLREDGGHSRTLFVAIEHLTRALGLAPSEIDAYAVAVGPGSFTGVRIGVSAVQGLALGSSRPCLGFTSLHGLAAKLQGSAAAAIVPMIDAYRDQVYGAVYESDLRLRVEPVAADPEALLAQAGDGPVTVVGDGAMRYRDRIAAARPDAVFADRSPFIAAALGRVAYAALAAGQGGPAASLRPLYLRAPDIGRPNTPLAAPA
jgi:tRNA threonylcarbamoyladenosine biosynthesis protein TsaB